MKNVIVSFVLAFAFLFSACTSSAPADASAKDIPAETPSQTQPVPTEPSTEPPTEAFDLDAYKAAVSECRAAIMDNALALGNVGSYEINFLRIRGSTSDSTADYGFDWLEENSEYTRESVDEQHAIIRKLYAELIIWEIRGNEAEELDKNIRSMYEGYADLYGAVTSSSYTYDVLTTKISNALHAINTGDDNLSLFLD